MIFNLRLVLAFPLSTSLQIQGEEANFQHYNFAFIVIPISHFSRNYFFSIPLFFKDSNFSYR